MSIQSSAYTLNVTSGEKHSCSECAFKQKCLQLAFELIVVLKLGRQRIPCFRTGMRKATFAELESGSKRFTAIDVCRSKSLPVLYIGCGHHKTGEIRRTAADVHLVH